MHKESELADLLTLDEYRARNERVFPSNASLSWFIRSHREGLVAAQAILVLNRRLLIEPMRFDAAVLAIGYQTASDRSAMNQGALKLRCAG
jgi:hypothetical protein